MDKTNYDVFISFKNSDANGQDTVDKEVARKVYAFLKAKNLKVFFSPVTLEELGRDSWAEEIHTALHKAKVFVALSSSKAYMEEKWPQRERTTFLTLKTDDETRAIYSYIASPMSTADLPDDVQKVECFQDRKEDALERLYRFSANHLARHAPQSDFNALAEKNNFSKEVFASLDRSPLLLFSTDAYNHTSYIAHIKQEACERFGKEHLLEINCG